MANTIEIVIRADNKASGQIKALVGDIGKQFESLGKKMAVGGLALGAAIAPAALGFKSAINSARQFDETMTDAQAILGVTRDEMQALNAQVLDLGAKSVAGPQAAAAAFVEIAGGVSDASLHMSILEAAMKTAEAGAADLGATTSGLVAIMNSYGFSADQTSRVSDIMTRTVGMGVLTMDELAVAMPQVTSIAKTMGVSFEELGSNVAYLTAQGLSANVASTQLRATMTAMMKPTAGMTAAFEELGVATGQELIENTGSLLAALWNIKNTSVYAEQGVGNIFGSVEAMNAVLSMMGGASTEFFEEFQMGLDGATEAARKIQLEGVNAQMALLKNQAEALKIEIGMMLLPVVNRIVGAVIPAVAALRSWARENPQVVKTIGMVVGALAGLAAAMTTGGGAVALLARTLPMLLNPVGLVVGALAGLGVAYKENLLGFGDFVRDIAAGATDLANQVVDRFREGGFAGVGQWALEQIKAGLQGVIDWGASVVSPIITDITTAFETGGLPAVGELILDKIGEGLTGAADWAYEHLVQPIIDALTGALPGGEEAEVAVKPTVRAADFPDMPLWEGPMKVTSLTWGGTTSLATGLTEMMPAVASEMVAHLETSLAEQLPGVDLYKLFGEAMGRGPKPAQPLPGIDLARLYGMDAESLERSMKEGGAADSQWTSLGRQIVDGIASGIEFGATWAWDHIAVPIGEAVAGVNWGDALAVAGGALQTVVDILGQGAVNFAQWARTNILYPVVDGIRGLDWAGALNVAGNVLGDILDLLAGGIVDFAQWARTNVLYPVVEGIAGVDWGGALAVAGNVLQTILDALAAGAVDFMTWAGTHIGAPIVSALAGLNWGMAFALGESVLEKIINAMVSGTFDFLGWVNRSIATPIANALNDTQTWVNVGTTLYEAAIKLLNSMFDDDPAGDPAMAGENVTGPMGEAIAASVEREDVASKLIIAGGKIAWKIYKGMAQASGTIALRFALLLAADTLGWVGVGPGTGALGGGGGAEATPVPGAPPGGNGGEEEGRSTGQKIIDFLTRPRLFHDMGGPHAGRGPVWIGSGQQPELFWPNEAGTFYPASRFGGGDAVNNWTVNLYGIQDMKQALDELEREARRRNRRLTVGMGGAG